MIRIFLAYSFCCCAAFYSAQTNSGFIWPLDTPHTLTGNYGELRPNHFHVGLDFSTNGKINFPVYAVADGYVSRIKVSSGGYGKAVYITHSGGKLSLYAHFNSYAPAIADAVKHEQYARQNYEVEIFPGKNDIRIQQGQLIGYSGNSGNSSGPHLHFEIRDEKTEVPLNPLEFYRIRDTLLPVVSHVAFYNLADTSAPVFLRGFAVERNRRDSLFLKQDSVVIWQSQVGLAFAGYDRFVYRGNPNVTYMARLLLDDNLVYSHKLHHISFSDQRFVNEFSETVNKVKYQKCFLPTLYPQGIYGETLNKGLIALADTNYHRVKLVLLDEQGNENMLQFYVKTKKPGGAVPVAAKGDLYANCNAELQAVKNGLRLYIPKGALYHSSPLFIRNSAGTTSAFSILPELNLAVPISVGFPVPPRFRSRASQLVVRNHSAVYVPVIRNDTAFCSVYNLGTFEIGIDTLAPKIKTQLGPKKIRRLKNFKEFSFILSDQLSGIARYSLFVNGQWALAEYDAKNRLLTYAFNDTTPAGTLTFLVTAEDRSGNKAQLKYVLKR